MIVTKIINNNAICSLDNMRREIVIMGCGLGFGSKIGQEVDESKIEKIFRMEKEDETKRLQDLLQDVPIERVQLVNEIIENATKVITDKIQRTIYITLLDHINFAIERFYQNIQLYNPLLNEIRRFYPREFLVGQEAVRLLNKKLSVTMPEDEAASIALHFINAELGRDTFEMVDLTKIIQNAVKITKYHYNVELNEDSLHFERFITHLKYFAMRVISKEKLEKEDEVLTQIIRTQYPRAYRCAEKIREYIYQEYGFDVSNAELSFLALHIERITM